MNTPPNSTDLDDTDNGADPESDTAFPKWLKWGLLGALAILIVGYGLIFLYAKVINDSPDELDQSDLEAALEADTTEQAERADGEVDAGAGERWVDRKSVV